MTDQAKDPAISEAVALLEAFSFDLGAFSAAQLVGYWLRRYSPQWIWAAIIEAIYQGRYKAVSVGQILAIWGRRGRPIYHFNSEFERVVAGRTVTTFANNVVEPPTEVRSEQSQKDGMKPPDIHPPGSPDGATQVKVDGQGGTDSSVQEEGGVDEDAIAPDVPNNPPADSPQVAEAQPSTASQETEPQSPPTKSEMNGTLGSLLTNGAADFAATEIPYENQYTDQYTALPVLVRTSGYSLPDAHAGSPEIWVRGDVTKHPIHRFVPEPEGSLFYVKLLAVARDVVFPQVSFP